MPDWLQDHHQTAAGFQPHHAICSLGCLMADEEVLRRVERFLERPMIVLAVIWLILLIVEVTHGLSPILSAVEIAIWIAFGVDFIVRLILAPRKLNYIRHNFITLLALFVPAFRLLRGFRALTALRLVQVGRSARLIGLLGTINRGMRALGKTLGRRGFGYVVAVTILVTIAGSAGMYEFEKDVPNGQGFESFWNALWWTAMVMTTMASGHWPETGAGRVLGFLLAVYGFTIFGYVTATLATFFLAQDAQSKREEESGRNEELEKFRADIQRLSSEIARFTSGEK